MSIRNLRSLLQPHSVALVGASDKRGAVGEVLARNLLAFKGELYFVNPKHSTLFEHPCWKDIAELPIAPDLAVICTPAATVPELIRALGIRGTHAAIVVSAGFGEAGKSGQALQQSILDAARSSTLRIVGPNCIGVLNPPFNLNASFAHDTALPGSLAFLSQSGALLTSVLDWARSRGIGFSHMISLGDMADVDFGDLLDYLATDPGTHAILLYIEGIQHARKFMSAARVASRLKPVIVVKSGRHAEGARAAATHTGALAGADRVYDAAFRRAGMLRVPNLGALFGAADILTLAELPRGKRLGILTNGGGMGVLATDALLDRGGQLAELSGATCSRLDAQLPRTWSHGNPVDIIGDANGARYAGTLEALVADPCLDAVLVLYCPTGVSDPNEVAEAVIRVASHASKPVLASWVGGGAVTSARQKLMATRMPSFETPESAVQAFMFLADYRRNHEMLTQTPASLPEAFKPDFSRARAVIAGALGEDREWLTEIESKVLLECYAIPTVPTRFASTEEDAARLAQGLPSPYVLKIVSSQITHKSDVGGVVLGLADSEAVGAAAQHMRAQLAERRPDAQLLGFAVQTMVQRPQAHELIAGISTDAQFGPVVLFGQGGTSAEVVGDTALALPPLNLHLAEMLMDETRVSRLLAGYRNRPPVRREAVALTLVKLAQLAGDLAEVVELDINPLLADDEGVLALDARVRVAPPGVPADARLAIRPYPRELEREFPLVDGRNLRLRPILPEDEGMIQQLFKRLSPEEIYMRFHGGMKVLQHTLAARLTQIDYDREMALVLAEPEVPGKSSIYAVVRLAADPDFEHAEFSLLVQHEYTGHGVGTRLMQALIEYARDRGIGELEGLVLPENMVMLDLCQRLGFHIQRISGQPDAVNVNLKLR
ncbi:MAG TPA: bifunctional acetate--CoA ligase family protein/GNAT family N-acetyltransferase [Gammaproteobacteria bacterium]|nr:bifunctional acetate--CoA ligase family protein/GNAT family N-acetyltransferase [Gammaproteobacteria bacterium]